MAKKIEPDLEKARLMVRTLIQTPEVEEYFMYLGLPIEDRAELNQMWNEYYDKVRTSESGMVLDEMKSTIRAWKAHTLSETIAKTKIATLRTTARNLINNPEDIPTPSKYDPAKLRNCQQVRDLLKYNEILERAKDGEGEFAVSIFKKV